MNNQICYENELRNTSCQYDTNNLAIPLTVLPATNIDTIYDTSCTPIDSTSGGSGKSGIFLPINFHAERNTVTYYLRFFFVNRTNGPVTFDIFIESFDVEVVVTDPNYPKGFPLRSKINKNKLSVNARQVLTYEIRLQLQTNSAAVPQWFISVPDDNYASPLDTTTIISLTGFPTQAGWFNNGNTSPPKTSWGLSGTTPNLKLIVVNDTDPISLAGLSMKEYNTVTTRRSTNGLDTCPDSTPCRINNRCNGGNCTACNESCADCSGATLTTCTKCFKTSANWFTTQAAGFCTCSSLTSRLYWL